MGSQWSESSNSLAPTSHHRPPSPSATFNLTPTPFSSSIHGGSADSSDCCATGLLSSPKFRGPSCASGHSTSWPSWLCFGAQRSFSRQTSAHAGHTHLCNAQNLVFWLCLGAHRKLARLARERFLDCAPIHSAKMASWSGLARIKTGTRTSRWKWAKPYPDDYHCFIAAPRMFSIGVPIWTVTTN